MSKSYIVIQQSMWCNKSSKPFAANKQAECDYMYSALRRMQVRGHLDQVYDGLPSFPPPEVANA